MAVRAIVCGGRDFTDRELCFEKLDLILEGCKDVEIISGHAKGADQFGEEYAEANDFKLKVFPADWRRYGKGAGPIRNREMLEYALEETPLVIAFWNGKSRGTRDMISRAQVNNVEVHVVYI